MNDKILLEKDQSVVLLFNKNIYYIDPYARYYQKDTASEETIDIGLIEEGNIVSVNSNKNLKLWKLNNTGDNYIWNVVENIPTEKDYVNDTDIEFNTTILRPNLLIKDNE